MPRPVSKRADVGIAGDVAGRRDHRVGAAARLPVERPRAGGGRHHAPQAAPVRADDGDPAAAAAPERERDPAAVGRPRRGAHGVREPGHPAQEAPVRAHHEQLAHPRRRAPASLRRLPRGRGLRSASRVNAIRRPSGDHVGSASSAPPVGQVARGAARGGHDHDVAVRAGGPVAHERQPAARRPGGRRVVGRARGQGAHRVAVDADGVEVAVARVAARERERVAGGRPRRVAARLGPTVTSRAFGAVGEHDPDLAVGRERDPRALRGERRVGRAPGHHEPARRRRRPGRAARARPARCCGPRRRACRWRP